MIRFFYSVIVVSLGFFGQAQITHSCDSIFYKTFCYFVRYDDTVGYSLQYKIPPAQQDCLADTAELINFLLSERFSEQCRLALGGGSPIRSLSAIEWSFLGHHTNHKKRKPWPDSLYKHISDSKIQNIGKGRQMIREMPLEVLKYYFISALYNSNFQFRNEIVLMKGSKILEIQGSRKSNKKYPGGVLFETEIKNKRILRLADKSYCKWSSRLKRLGLDELRKDNVHPLSFAPEIKWRNNRYDPFDGAQLK